MTPLISWLTSPRLALLVAVAFFLPPALNAQEKLPHPAETAAVRRLTLDEARQLALGNNKALALARINVAEKEHGVAAAKKDYLPKLIGNVTYFHFNDDLGRVLTSRGPGIIVPPGTTVNANVLNQNSTFSTLFVAQPITKLIAVNAAVQLARADECAARAQLDKGTRDVLSGVSQAYHGLLGARRIEAALVLQVNLLDQLVKAKPVPELQVGLVEARQGLLQVRGQARELSDLLNNLLDLPGCTELELLDPLPAELPVKCAEEAAEGAVACSPEVREAEQSVAKAAAALQVAKMEYLPDVAVLGGYANQTAASYIQDNIGYVGVTGTWKLWEWGKKKDVRRQRETLIAVARQNVEVTADKVRLEARKAFNSYEQARQGYRLAAELVQARKSAEKAAVGPDAFQAKADTSKAELEQMKAEITYRVAHAQFAALIGKE